MNRLSPPLDRRDRRRRRRQADLTRWGILGGVVLLAFVLGIALGQALNDNPKPGGTITLERTLRVPTGNPGSTASP